jgi:hypothetical protein
MKKYAQAGKWKKNEQGQGERRGFDSREGDREGGRGSEGD